MNPQQFLLAREDVCKNRFDLIKVHQNLYKHIQKEEVEEGGERSRRCGGWLIKVMVDATIMMSAKHIEDIIKRFGLSDLPSKHDKNGIFGMISSSTHTHTHTPVS